jgi:hypothetical protein
MRPKAQTRDRSQGQGRQVGITYEDNEFKKGTVTEEGYEVEAARIRIYYNNTTR